MLGALRHRIAFQGGTALLRREWWRAAAFMLRRATRLVPGQWEAHNNLTVALLKLERWDEAAGTARRAIDVNPAAVDSHDFLGIALLQLGRWEEAVTAYRRALAIDPRRYELYDRLGMALSRLERWQEVVETYEGAVKLRAGQYTIYHRLGIAHAKLERWAAAAVMLRCALELAEHDSAATAEIGGIRMNLADAEEQLDPADQALTAELLQRAESLHPGAAAGFSRGIELLERGQWGEALSHLRVPMSDVASLELLSVDPLVRLGRLTEAVAAHRRVVAAKGLRPALPGVPASERFKARHAGFWKEENLAADVFTVERWLEELQVVGEGLPDAPRLLFVLDNDFGELTTVKYLLLGQDLAAGATLLLPQRLYADNADAIAGRTHRYNSVDDILEAADREHSQVVFLCSGYLLCPHLDITPDDLARLVDGLSQRGCQIVTADPFLGVLSRQDPRAVISFEIARSQPETSALGADPAADEMTLRRRAAHERGWDAFTRSESILRDTYHLYPSYCDVARDDGADTDARNLSFFNDRLVRPAASGTTRPHWLFVLSAADCEIQWQLEGKAGFADIVAGRLLETLAAGRHPILIGPRAFVDGLMARMPTAEGIDILPFCPFTRFMALLLSAEHAFYWNAVSHSVLIRLYNQLPIVLFDHGHLIRTASPVHDRIVRWYYQGWTPPIREHRSPLTLQTVEEWAAEYGRNAGGLVGRFRRAPSPEQMIADVLRQPFPAAGSAGTQPVLVGDSTSRGTAA